MWHTVLGLLALPVVCFAYCQHLPVSPQVVVKLVGLAIFGAFTAQVCIKKQFRNKLFNLYGLYLFPCMLVSP